MEHIFSMNSMKDSSSTVLRHRVDDVVTSAGLRLGINVLNGDNGALSCQSPKAERRAAYRPSEPKAARPLSTNLACKGARAGVIRKD